MRIGVIADTHGYLDPVIFEKFQGVAHILHAGDIGDRAVVTRLEKIAPVTAVIGNVDAFLTFAEMENICLNGNNILLQHIFPPDQISPAVAQSLRQQNVQAVVFGHTHRPLAREEGSVWFFNPGYAGPQRFQLPRSVGILDLEPGSILAHHISLGKGTAS